MSNQPPSPDPLAPGEQVADAEVTEVLGAGGGIHAWTAQREGGSKAVVFALATSFGPMARDKFLGAASDWVGRAPEGVIPIVAIDPLAGAYVGDVDASGTFADLHILNWDRKRTVTFFKRICEIVAGMHEQGIIHGWLRPENVLLDASLEPIIANPRMIDIGTLCRSDASSVWMHRVYSPPEVRHGAVADARADTYALGRMLHFALKGDPSDEKDERLPRLDALYKDNPSALVRIVRKCTSMDASERYDSARELLDDLEKMDRHIPVGTPHPDIDGAEESSMIDDAALLSKPPPSKAKSKRGAGVAIEINQDPDQRFWSPAIAIGMGLVGLLMLGIPAILAYSAGVGSIGVSIAFWLAAIPIGLATPGFKPNPLLARALIAVVVGAVLVLLNPIPALVEMRSAALESSDPGERLEAFKSLVADGEKDFRAINLEGVDLTGFDATELVLDGANLKNCICVDVNFSNASLTNADMTGADLSGANLDGTVGAFIKFFEMAKCNDATRLPASYRCEDGAPAPAAAP